MQKSLHLKKRGHFLLILLLSLLWMANTYAQSSGALNGIFSVSENTQVNFSQGNLQYVGSFSTPYWKFAEHQWDYFGSTQNGTSQNVDRDLFGFSTSGYDHGAIQYQPWSTSTSNTNYYAYGSASYNLYDQSGKADWGYNAIVNGGNQENQWRTLTNAEWYYLFYIRATPSGIRYAKAVVNEVNGVILFPDNWSESVFALGSYNNSYYSDNTITVSDWTNILEPAGAVFLPASGYRYETGTGNVNQYGYYWSSSVYSDAYAYGLYFNTGSLYPQNTISRYYGCAVRLVKNCPVAMGFINANPNPTEGGTVTGQGFFNVGETCTLVASANSKYVFVNWTKDGVEVSTDLSYSFRVTGNASYLANFRRTDTREVVIGAGASNYSYYMPLNSDYPYSFVQQIYTAEEIGTDGPIEGISFYLRDDLGNATANVDVYLKHISRDGFESSSDWENLNMGDLYYSGSFSYGGNAGWKYIRLDNPFNYNGVDNLLVCIDNNTGYYSYYSYWNVYPTNGYRARYAYSDNNLNPFNPSGGSLTNYNNQIRFSFLITQEASFVATPNPIDLGHRPSGAWMRPYQVGITNEGRGTFINSVSITDSYFQLDNDFSLPFYLGYNDGLELVLNTGTGEGEANASLVISYGEQNQQVQYDVTATAYSPALGDVWETAELLTDFPFSATLTSAYIPLFDNYRLPPSGIPDGPDAVYKLVFTEDTYLNVSVSDGENGKVALYPEGFNNTGGPDLDNNYVGSVMSCHEWLTYDNGTTYTNVRHNSGTTTWGYKFPANELAAYAGAKMTQVALYSNSYNGGPTTVMIYTGGENAPETLVSTQNFSLPSGLYDYYNVTLDTPLRITGRENVWVIFSAVNNDRYPAVCTDYYFDSQYNGCWWYNYYSEVWMQNRDYGNWKIKAYVTSGDDRSIAIGEDKTGNRDIVTIGDGSTTTYQYLPSYSYYNYSLTQQLYTSVELGQAGNISSIAFYNGGSEKTRNFTIYMVNTDKSEFTGSNDWIPVLPADQVFSGNVTMLPGDWTTIQLDTPFEYYEGSNLALVVADNTGSYSSGMACRVFTSESNSYCSLYAYRDGSNYDPYHPAAYDGNRTRSKNQIQLNITPTQGKILNMTVLPGTYYLVASSTSESWSIDINAEAMPCPQSASNPMPEDNATSVSPTLAQLKWNFGKGTTGYMLKFGATPECEDTLVEWTRDLSNTYTLMGLDNSIQYYWQVVERNDGCSEGVEGPIWKFTTRLEGPRIYANSTYLYVGDTLQLTWNALADTCVHSYNIYQNDMLIGNCSTNHYNITNLDYSPTIGYTYKVSAVYEGGESSFYNSINVRVSGYTTISGHVYEQDGTTPIPNAKVTYSGRDEFNYTRKISFITDSNGYYDGALYVGSYQGQASCQGYQSESYPDGIAMLYGIHTADIDYVMDESFLPVGDVVAQYYPDALDPSSPYVKVYWDQKTSNIEDFETGGFSRFNWQLDPVYPWQIDTNDPYEGYSCMKSGNYNVSSSTSSMQLEFDVPFGSQISFFCRISSESGYDYGSFYIDDNKMGSWSGNRDWTECVYPVTAGTHVFKWIYSKDSSVNSGDDCFYVDYISFYDEGSRGEAQNRSFQHYRVYRTDFYNDGPYTLNNTVLIADEITDTLHIDPSWADAEMGVYKYGVSKVYEGNRENGVNLMPDRNEILFMDDFESGMGNWTTIDADGDGYNWQFNSSFGGHEGSSGMVNSASYNSNAGPLFPDNYLVSPLVSLGGSFSFWVCAQDNLWAAEHFGIAVSTTVNDNASAFTTLQEWTLSAKDNGAKAVHRHNGNRDQGTWYQYTVDLSSYVGQTGYVAIRHFNCSDEFYLNVDDVVILDAVSVQGDRESAIRWSNPVDKAMSLTNGVDITVSLNNGDSPEGVSVTFINLNADEQQAHPGENDVVLDASGYYVWNNFRKGDYQISIAKEGYDTLTEQVSIWADTSLNYVLDESIYGANSLYVSRTGWAMWHDHNNSPIPELAGDSFEYDFDNGNMNGMTFIDVDSYGSSWMLASQKFGTGCGHNGSMDCLVSQSYDYENYRYLYPDEYVVFPLVKFGSNSTLSFWARQHYDVSYSEGFSVAVSTSSNSVPDDFMTVQSWTLDGNQGNWVHFAVNLGEYAGQMGYIAIRHYNNGSSSRNALDIDDVALYDGSRGGNGSRQFENYQVMLTDAEGQSIYSGSTSDCFIQLPTEGLIDGETYHCKVAGVYSSGVSEWQETDWVYQSCSRFEGVSELNMEMGGENNVISWTYPETGHDDEIPNTVFACSYYSPSWISYSIDNPQSVRVLNSNVSVYGGDYCGADGYVHATYSNNNWYKIDPSTGTIVEQGPLGRYFYDCAWDYSTNTMFGIYNSRLYLWDLEYNTVTQIGYLDDDMRVLACDFEGQLWGISYYGYLYKIDKTTATSSYIGNTGYYADYYIQSAGFDHKTGKLYWMNSDYGYLFEVNTETCQLKRLATNMGQQSSWCIPYTGGLPSSSGILGAAIYRDDEFAGFVYGDEFTDTFATGNHEYSVRAVYDGTKREPYWNTYFSMSCPNTIGGETYTVSATASPSVGGAVTGSGSYINGFSCTLTATANTGYVFANWTENGEVVSNCPEYTFVVRGNHNIIGNFIEYNPHWTVVNTPTYSDMSVIGIVQFNGVEQTADYYEVGAFCNGECRGRQVLTYNPQLHRSVLTMTIRGRNNDKLTFKVYDHLNDEEIDLVCMNELTFAMNTVVGSFASPYSINFGTLQSTDIQEGWNWYSTFIEQENIDGLRMLENSLGSEGVMIKSQDEGFVINYQNIWSGSLNSLRNEQMYMINANRPTVARVVGNKADRASHPVTLYPGWTWIGNPYETTVSIQDALAGFTPSEGDIMKSQQSFSSYMDGLGWFGSFNTLDPGAGFMYYSNNNRTTTLHYAGLSDRQERMPNITADDNHWVPDAFEYPYNMTMMAVVMLDNIELSADRYELAVFANGKCIGSSRLLYNGSLNRYMAYLTIYGEEAVDIRFGLYDASSGLEYHSADETLVFAANSIIGSLAEPFAVHFDGTAGLNQGFETSVLLYPNPVAKGENCKVEMLVNGSENATIEIIDVLGSVISVKNVHQQPVSITAPGTAGVYTVRITVEGQGSHCRKLIVK